jgi:(p)ppGpp synthase/HD superfamily hydrolase
MDDICAMCILHDCLEDTDTTRDQLCDLFGCMVADTVFELTNDQEEIERIGKQAYLDKKLLALSNYALAIKLADMLANITDAPTEDLLKRISHHISFLKSNRELTGSQGKIVNHIEQVLHAAV